MRRPEFLEAQRCGARVSSRYFLIMVRGRLDAGAPRLGITVTRKVGKAVRRNRIKRLVREWFRLDGVGLGPHDLVVIAKRDLPTGLTAQEVRDDLSRALASAGYASGNGWSGRSGRTSGSEGLCSAPPAASTRAAPSTPPK
ncbi:MAG: ribonuclease P protein component [Myxococcota bacterium]